MTLVLVDECVSVKFAKYLRRRGVEGVVCVREEHAMRGMRDSDLASFIMYYRGILITRDREFYNNFIGKKVPFNNRNWRSVLEKIIYKNKH